MIFLSREAAVRNRVTWRNPGRCFLPKASHQMVTPGLELDDFEANSTSFWLFQPIKRESGHPHFSHLFPLLSLSKLSL